MSFRERWTKKFVEKKSFRLWLDLSEGKISEQEFKAKMDIKVMPRVLGKMSAARMNALGDEVENLKKMRKVNR